MDRNRQLIFAAIAAVVLVLLIACGLNYLALQTANQELDHYKKQQKEIAKAITADYLVDMQAAKMTWVQAHQDEMKALNNEGIGLEADYVETPYYSAALDPANPYYVNIGPAGGDVESGQVKIGLGQYYDSNSTSASGWSVTYVVNRTTHHVAGFTASLIQTIAYNNYVANVAPGINTQLGVADGMVTGESPATLDTSYMAESDTWIDVTEHKYWLKNTDLTQYMTIKTYVNGSTEQVTGVDISRPYYTSQATVMH